MEVDMLHAAGSALLIILDWHRLIFLFGGVKVLSLDSIVAQLNQSVISQPYQIIIGTGTNPLKVQPSIFLNNKITGPAVSSFSRTARKIS